MKVSCKICDKEFESSSRHTECAACRRKKTKAFVPVVRDEIEIDTPEYTGEQIKLIAEYQSGLLYCLMDDNNFLRSVIDELKPELLETGEAHLKLLKIIREMHYKLKTPLTVNMVKQGLKIKEEQNKLSYGDVFSINNIIFQGQLLKPEDYAKIKEDCIAFINNQKILLEASRSLILLREGNTDAFVSNINAEYRKLISLDKKEATNYFSRNVVTDMEEARSGVWQLGMPTLDAFLGGGLGKAETLNLLAFTGTGKTTLMLNWALSAAKQGLSVLFITLELSKKKCEHRLDIIETGLLDIAKIADAKIDLQKKFNTAYKDMRLFIEYFPRHAITPTQLEVFIDNFISEHGTVDVIFIDWIGALKLRSTTDNLRKDETITEAADAIVSMGIKYNCSMITSQQTNSLAISKRRFTMEAANESRGALHGMDFVIGMGKSQIAGEEGERTLNILKAREGTQDVWVDILGDKKDAPKTYRFKEAL